MKYIQTRIADFMEEPVPRVSSPPKIMNSGNVFEFGDLPEKEDSFLHNRFGKVKETIYGKFICAVDGFGYPDVEPEIHIHTIHSFFDTLSDTIVEIFMEDGKINNNEEMKERVDKTLKYIKPLFKNEMRNMGFDLLLAYYDVWTMKFTYFSIGSTKPFISQNGERYRTDDHPYIFSDFSQELLDKLKINGLKEGCNVINGSIGPAVNVIRWDTILDVGIISNIQLNEYLYIGITSM